MPTFNIGDKVIFEGKEGTIHGPYTNNSWLIYYDANKSFKNGTPLVLWAYEDELTKLHNVISNLKDLSKS